MRSINFLVIVLVFILASSLTLAGSCCKVAVNGQTCVPDLTESSCKENMFVQTDCSDLDECSIKVCCDTGDKCLAGSNQVSCNLFDGSPYEESPECELSQCNKNVCCNVAGSFYVIDKSKCDDIVSDVKDPSACAELNYNSVKGCCEDSGKCSVTDKEDCYKTAQTSEVQFFMNEKCSNVEKCSCKKHDSVRASEDKHSLFYYDSCGNIEDKFKDCAEGEIAAKDDSGEYSCISLNCKKTWDNPYTDENFDNNTIGDGVSRVDGESWCEYQQVQVGLGRDLPGTHHYIHTCKSGFESVQLADSDSGARTSYCVETRNNGKSHAEVKTIQPDCQEYDFDIEACNKNKGCTYVPVKGLLGWKVYFAKESYSSDKSGKGFGVNDKYNIYDMNGNLVQEINWNTVRHRTDDNAAFYDPKLKVVDCSGYTCSKWYTVSSFIFVDSNLIEPNKNYFTKQIINGKDSDNVIYFDTYPPDGVNGSCVPVVAPESSNVNKCSDIDVFNTNDITKWAGWMIDLPVDIAYYSDYINKFAEISREKYQKEFILEMANRKANAYNSRCGANYNYIGKFSNNLEWKVPSLGLKSADVQPLLDVYVNRNNNLFELAKYGFAKTENFGPKRPGGTINA